MSKVYVIGATGGIGNQLVKILLSRGVLTTVLVRDPSKAAGLFGESENLTVVQGDYADNEAFKQSIVGHERLFLLVRDFYSMAAIKRNFAQIAYASGVKQIVDVSSGTVNGAWREHHISTMHYASEEAIFNLPDRGSYVTLRPTQFFSNHFFADHQTVKFKNAIFGSANPNSRVPWISPTDIAELAANVLTEPIEKHGDMVYHMTSEVLSGNDRAKILSRVLGKDVKYVQISAEEQYKAYVEHVHVPHSVAYGFVDASLKDFEVNHALSIVLHRPPQSLEPWLELNKDKF
ncbi:hypothetical protein K450DRAFT_243820 [Umbelopsis ramanniana AG]|uniref:NmrA-like domain-containing protein n=1 Tax=Umbelopsis ramanniana AG TaxID=1314678 RepID=A0AAD5HDK9_UMBRA|nr:uncharacterized protein K450DRAFT_243820 [Umbelopsis ramanniana AG]KAI8579089.1 hypothetical protein K450DRAFT_243820 [Umbelopsis ramanniana AG]